MTKRKPHSEETKRKISIAHMGKKGHPSWNKGTGEIHKIKYCKCGEVFYSKKKQRRFCSTICASKNLIGHKFNLGRKQTQEEKNKHSIALKGKIPKNLEMLHKQPVSDETRNKKRIAQTGELGSNWKGGITSLVKLIRRCFKYRQWVSDIFTRDDYTCQECGVKGGTIHADHFPKTFSNIFHENNIKSLEEALNCEEFWNINNGRTLCKPCHMKTDTWGAKKQKAYFTVKELNT